MINKKFISDHDIELFKEALENVQPLKQKNQKLDPSSSNHQNSKKNFEPLPTYSPPNFNAFPQQTSLFVEELLNESSEISVTAQDQLFFCGPGLQKKRMQKLKKGQIPIKASIDLHGMRAGQALQALEHFFSNTGSSGNCCFCVIHGKGQDFPVLKNLVNRFLKQNNRVLAFCSAPIFLGGTGATLVLLKSN